MKYNNSVSTNCWNIRMVCTCNVNKQTNKQTRDLNIILFSGLQSVDNIIYNIDYTIT